MRAEYGLDKLVYLQYASWVGDMLHGDFGQLFKHKKPVTELLADRLPRTLIVALISHFFATLIGIGLGIYAAINQNRLGDLAATALSFLGMSTPRFFPALLVIHWLVFVIDSQNVGGFYSARYVFEPWSLAKL